MNKCHIATTRSGGRRRAGCGKRKPSKRLGRGMHLLSVTIDQHTHTHTHTHIRKAPHIDVTDKDCSRPQVRTQRGNTDRWESRTQSCRLSVPSHLRPKREKSVTVDCARYRSSVLTFINVETLAALKVVEPRSGRTDGRGRRRRGRRRRGGQRRGQRRGQVAA